MTFREKQLSENTKNGWGKPIEKIIENWVSPTMLKNKTLKEFVTRLDDISKHVWFSIRELQFWYNPFLGWGKNKPNI